ncbi:PilC/PilY family type IV pilus protein [Acinetobacter johnsonii]|uniref:PilC/PilY family type IV pilus protein n=1 Tax=Acinetobacter johnsonii TaxID=40214 RepID=UPI002449B78A|nr:PilC/PilY family type IV pilus protein [Acinetobacter johnsonii]MDH0710402.1 PilC/PilY family type IV pilus protein [Acinetobacter johnsonii]
MKTLNSRNVLSTAVSALMTMMVCSSVSRASDIDIYQNAQPTTITLMMLIDISGSMDYSSYGGGAACDLLNSNGSSAGAWSGKATPNMAIEKINTHADVPVYRRQWCEYNGKTYPDRITRVKDAMMDLLFGNDAKGVTPLSDANIIGLSSIGWVKTPTDPMWDGTNTLAPLSPMRCDARQTKDNKNNTVDKLDQYNKNCNDLTLFPRLAGDVKGKDKEWENYGSIVVPARRLDETLTINGVSITQRKYLAQKVAELAAVTNTPTASAYAETAAYLLGTSTKMSNGYFGFESSNENAKSGDSYAAPASMTQTEDQKQCRGQGIYVLTDGEPYDNTKKFNELTQKALGASGSVCSIDSNSTQGVWNCIDTLAAALLDPSKNPKGVKIKTAVVGFGNSFNNIESYDPTKSKAENIEALGNIDEAVNKDVTKKAAAWGIRGEGGWYSGKNTEDVVNSVQQFLGQIEVEIPAVATGSPTLPQDALNPLRIQPYGYYASFLPKPQETTQLWVGNMNKYHIFNGELYNNSKTIRLIKADGSLDSTAEGLWTNGIKGQLPLGIGTNAANEQVANRTIYTNREITGTATPYAANETNSLKKVNMTTLFGTDATAVLVNDPDKNYWLNLLGYNVGATETGITLENLAAKPELRQVGAVMHSTPILLTQRGQIKYSSGTIDTTDRDDFLLFGSTQGLLHVVDADTGVEKFAFAPNEMMQRQKAAFLSETSSIGGSSSLFYGIDAPWTAYTQYVSKADGTLTVKNSDRNSDGGTNTDLALKGLQWVYGGLRMGGRSYYALDLSDLDKPSLKFHINPDAAVTAGEPDTSNALSYMGQSWSKPTLAYVKFGGVKKLVMFVGGGYDTGYETAAYDQNTNTTGSGAGVYMFDANNGNLLWWTSANATAAKGAEAFTDASASTVNMKYSVVSQINAIDRDNDGLADNLYFGDLGGQAFRIDLNNAATGADASAKKVNFAKRVVRLFNGNVSGGASPRFYEMPSVSIHEDNGYVAAVAFSSGNRSSPLVGTAVTGGNQAGSTVSAADGVFVVYDKDVARTDLYNTLPDTGATGLKTKNIALTSLNSNISTGVAVTGNNGWKYIYSNTAGVYKGMNELYAVDGMLYVNVYHRDGTGIGGSCGAGVKGDSYIYQFCLPTGKCSFATTNANTPNSVKLGAGILGAGLGQGFSNANNTGLIVKRPTTLDCATTPNLPECQEFTTTAKLRQLRWYETQ